MGTTSSEVKRFFGIGIGMLLGFPLFLSLCTALGPPIGISVSLAVFGLLGIACLKRRCVRLGWISLVSLCFSLALIIPLFLAARAYWGLLAVIILDVAICWADATLGRPSSRAKERISNGSASPPGAA